MSMQRILRAPAITLHTMAGHLAMSNARCGPPQSGGKPHGDKSGQREGGPENRFFADVLNGRPLLEGDQRKRQTHLAEPLRTG